MLSKTALCMRGKCNLLTNRFRAMSGYSAAKRVKDPHMNDVPAPVSFQECYNKRQKGNNTTLVAGVLFFAFSSYYVIQSGVIVPNLTPPRKNPE